MPNTLFAGQLSGWDFLIAGLIVLFVEYPIKTWIFKSSEKYKVVYKLAPVVVALLVYLVLAFILGNEWYAGLLHGLAVGLTAMGSYDLILKTMKKSGLQSLEDLNKAVKEAIEDK